MIAQATDFNGLERISSTALLGANIGFVISSLLPYIFAIAGATLVVYLLYGGFHLMASRGDEKAIKEAKGKITGALTGLVIMIVAYMVTRLIGVVFDIAIITSIFP